MDIIRDYLKISIILEVILVIFIMIIRFSKSDINMFIFSWFLVILTLLNIFVLIYFKAKKHKKNAYLVSILFIIQGLLTLFGGEIGQVFTILLIFSIIILGSSAYLLWKE